MGREMVMVSKFGQMVLDTKANGKIIEQMGRESFITMTVITIKENGKMTNLTEKDFISIKMGDFMMENGLKNNNMDMV